MSNEHKSLIIEIDFYYNETCSFCYYSFYVFIAYGIICNLANIQKESHLFIYLRPYSYLT